MCHFITSLSVVSANSKELRRWKDSVLSVDDGNDAAYHAIMLRKELLKLHKHLVTKGRTVQKSEKELGGALFHEQEEWAESATLFATCPQQWTKFAGWCWKLAPGGSWDQGERWCQKQHAHLARPESEWQEHQISEFLGTVTAWIRSFHAMANSN